MPQKKYRHLLHDERRLELNKRVKKDILKCEKKVYYVQCFFKKKVYYIQTF